MARPVLRRVSNAIAVFAIAAALIRSITTVWFSSEIIPTEPTLEIAAPPLTDRVVLVVVDGLRYDTALEGPDMPLLQATARAGASGLSMASLVTMTGLGVRTLGTGTSPALADILLESNLPAISFDNIFASLRRRGGHIAWFGNPSWKELFGAWIDRDPKIDRSLEMLSRSNNIWPADKVIVRRAVAFMARDDWQLSIVHIGGLDNASHRFTPFGDEFRAKARAVDGDLAKLVAAAGPRTTVIITSDHGTSDRGHHGSGEPITRRTPLVFTGKAVAPGHHLDARQTDVAPTIAALLGIPIPAPSEGQILLDGLDVSPATAEALRAANLRQHQRYAAAYAAAHEVDPPELDASPAGMRRLGDWIETTRASSSLVPAFWAACLLLAALGLFAALRPIVTVTSVIVIAVASWSFATGGSSEIAALVGVVASGVGTIATVRVLPRRWALLAGGAALLAAVEVMMVLWKLHHRYVEMQMHDVYDASHLTAQTFQLAMVGLVAAGLAVIARRWRLTTLWAAILVVVIASALADSVAIPAAMVGGIVAALATARPRELWLVVAAAIAGVAAIAIVDSPAWSIGTVEWVAPLALSGLGVWLGPARLRGRAALLGFGVIAVIVRLAGNPALPYRGALVAIMATAVILSRVDRHDRPLALVGWAGAIALAMLSRSAQLPGLIAWATFAALVGRSVEVEKSMDGACPRPAAPPNGGAVPSTERTVLVVALAVIAFRFACFALFEGVFEFSHLEVWLAYEGNPGTTVAFGAAIIAIKFALPLTVGFALITARCTPAVRRAAIGWVVAFLCMRIAHIVLGMTAARGTFYSPYLDSGQLVFTGLMLASSLVVIPLFVAVGAWRADADDGNSSPAHHDSPITSTGFSGPVPGTAMGRDHH